MFIYYTHLYGGSVVKNSPASARDSVLVLDQEMATYFSILAWEVPWTEKYRDHQFAKSRTGFSN